MDLRSYLESKGCRVKGRGPNVNLACFFHGEDSSKRGRLYINISEGEEQGLYTCFVCGAKGNLRSLLRHFGDEPDEQLDDSPLAKQLVLQDAAKFYADNLHPKVAEWLRSERGLSNETIATRLLGWAPSEDESALYRFLRSRGHSVPSMLATGLVVQRGDRCRDFLSGVVTIPYTVHGNVVLIRGKEMAGKYLTPPGQVTRIFNVDATYNHDVITITEGEFDCLVLEQLGLPAVGIPGARVWQESWNQNFESARRVNIMFDPDDVGLEGAIKVKDQLGSKSRIIDIPVPIGLQAKDVDPSYLVVSEGWGLADFEDVIAQSLHASTLLVTVDEAFEEWQGLQGAEGLKFGMDDLDWALNPGLLPAQVMIVLAKTNAGKTLVLLNMFHRMAMAQPELKILFVSLEQTRGDWFERARRIWNFYNLDCELKDLSSATLDFWRPRLELVDRNRVSEAELLTALEEYEARKGGMPDLLAVDYLGYWAAGFRGRDRYEKVSDAIMSLKAVAKESRLAIISPHQVNRLAEFGQEFEIDKARESGVVEETADFAMSLWSPDSMKGMTPEEKTGVVHMAIGKSRHGGKGQKIDLQFAPLSLAMVPIEDTARLRLAKDELSYQAARETWEQAIWRHRTGISLLSGAAPSATELLHV